MIRKMSSSVRVEFPCSTMDLVETEEAREAVIRSTVPYMVENDFCPATRRGLGEVSIPFVDIHIWQDLLKAQNVRTSPLMVSSLEMDLLEASAKRGFFDKVIMLVLHGESHTGVSLQADTELTQRGVGQVLSLSRRTSAFLNEETGLFPELVVVPPTKSAVETALLSIPQYSPYSVRNVPWVCHPAATSEDSDIRNLLKLESDFPRIDYSRCYSEPAVDSQEELAVNLLNRSNVMLEWLSNRKEQVVYGTLFGVLERQRPAVQRVFHSLCGAQFRPT